MNMLLPMLRLALLTLWLVSPTAADFNSTTTLLQDIVTWDDKSLFVYGERVLILSGEFHPFRLPSPDLWLDVFQKIRAIGFSGVSFYLDWALLEGEPGHIRTEGVFAVEQFFDAAQEAGIYLIARPGPYINAETSGGGFPGWLERLDGALRHTDAAFLDAITPYIAHVGGIVAKAQITNGGPVIMVQPENEYSLCVNETGYYQVNNMTINEIDTPCLEKEYMAYVELQFRNARVVVPFIVNDVYPEGNFAPGTGVGAVDIYSFDFYPLGWSTAQMSPTTPFSISEFQGGAPDAWGGVGVEESAAYIGPEFERVFYKLNYGYRAAIHSLYMIFGGTNWGNLGYSGGYTSYDVGTAIMEDRQVIREKYSELKLQAGLLQASPAYLLSEPDRGSYGIYTNSTTLATTRLSTNSTASFYIVRHGDLEADNTVSYTLQVSTSLGNLSIPQLGGSLSLHGRDSKIHVVDYDLGGVNLIYSSAELFSWKNTVGEKSVLVLYGGEGETHEFAVPSTLAAAFLESEGDGLIISNSSTAIIVNWSVESSRRVVHFGDQLDVYLLWRNDAYNYWTIDLSLPEPINRHTSSAESRISDSVIVRAGYLVRTAEIDGNALKLTGDVNATTEIELIASPSVISTIYFNGQQLDTEMVNGRLQGNVTYVQPDVHLPDLTSRSWYFIDSLSEIQDAYDDSCWTTCNSTTTNNPRNLTTPNSLYSSDYGYNAGSLLYRGSFIANGSESSFYFLTEGGYAYSHSVWLNSTYLTSWPGSPNDMFYNQTVSLAEKLHAGEKYVITIVIDHLGNDENFPVNAQVMKDPRGLIDYDLNDRNKDVISWKITGNLGGEQYQDLSRGPYNEGGFYAERQGYHLPGAPYTQWKLQSPFDNGSITAPGLGLWATSFDLNLPTSGYDIPLSFVFTNTTTGTSDSLPANFRAQLFVNGWQFGKYVNNIGPQIQFPVPEGILNYQGSNYLALTTWSIETKPF